MRQVLVAITMLEQHPKSLLDLPVEVLDAIVQTVPTADLLSLSPTSRIMNAVVTRWLYRRVTIRSLPQSVRCCKTLIANLAAAHAMREIAILATVVLHDAAFRSYFNLLLRALRATHHLESLTMICLIPFYANLLNMCTFPRLRHAFFTATSIAHVSPFLRAHPQIQDLQCITVEPNHDTTELYMPSVTHFTGYSSLLKLVARSAPPIVDATVMWNIEVEDHAEVERVFEALGRCKTLTTLVSMSRGWDRMLVEAMARHVPWVNTIFIHNLMTIIHTEDLLGSDAMDALAEFLSRFKSLVCLGLRCGRRGDRFQTAEEDDCMHACEFDVIMRMGHQCPSLNLVHIFSGTKWYRIAPAIWLPKSIGSGIDLLSVPWYQRMLLSNKYPEVYLALVENVQAFGLDIQVLEKYGHSAESM